MADDTFLEGGDRAGRAGETFIETPIGGASHAGGFQPLPDALTSRGYRVVRELGFGAEARVWLCTNQSGREFAIKLYFRAPKYTFALDSPEYRAHFSPEWTVQVFERGSDHVAGTEMHYEVMEYCGHGTLEEFTASHGRTDELSTAIVERLSWCIKSLQGERGKVVHGDIKPRNILVRNADRVELVLTDFGLTIDLGERSNLSNFGQGTTAYNAPEIVRVKGTPADWWSLGMVMYTVLVGRGYYQISDDRWATQRTIEVDLISRDISLSAIDAVDATPAPDEQPDQVEPFAFAGVGEFTSPQALGEAMAARPEDAARMLSGKGTDRLLAWLRDDVRDSDDYSELGHHNWDPDAKVTYLVGRLAPDFPLSFRSRPIGSPAELRKLVQSGDVDVVDALYTADLLGSIAVGSARSGYRMIQVNWTDLVDLATDAARQRGIPLSEDAQRHIRMWALLLAASDASVVDSYLDGVRTRINSPQMAAAGDVSWFVALRRDAGL